jgi:hypothetical protein
MAPDPPPPAIITSGSDSYPLPRATTLIAERWFAGSPSRAYQLSAGSLAAHVAGSKRCGGTKGVVRWKCRRPATSVSMTWLNAKPDPANDAALISKPNTRSPAEREPMCHHHSVGAPGCRYMSRGSERTTADGGTGSGDSLAGAPPGASSCDDPPQPTRPTRGAATAAWAAETRKRRRCMIVPSPVVTRNDDTCRCGFAPRPIAPDGSRSRAVAAARGGRPAETET